MQVGSLPALGIVVMSIGSIDRAWSRLLPKQEILNLNCKFSNGYGVNMWTCANYIDSSDHCGKPSQQIFVGWPTEFHYSLSYHNDSKLWTFTEVWCVCNTMSVRLKCNSNFHVDIHWNFQCVILWISGQNTMSISTWIFTEIFVQKLWKMACYFTWACASMKFSAQETEIWVIW